MALTAKTMKTLASFADELDKLLASNSEVKITEVKVSIEGSRFKLTSYGGKEFTATEELSGGYNDYW